MKRERMRYARKLSMSRDTLVSVSYIPVGCGDRKFGCYVPLSRRKNQFAMSIHGLRHIRYSPFRSIHSSRLFGSCEMLIQVSKALHEYYVVVSSLLVAILIPQSSASIPPTGRCSQYSKSSSTLGPLFFPTLSCLEYISATCLLLVASSGFLSSRILMKRGNLKETPFPPCSSTP